MADWSKIFERRLSAVLSEGRGRNNSIKAGTELELTPPPTVDKESQSSACNPTASFFDSICREVNAGRCAGGEAFQETQPAVHTTTDPIFHNIGRPVTKRLQETYSDRAKTLHDDATKRLSDAQIMFEKELHIIAEAENGFSSYVKGQHLLFNKPLSEWAVKIQTCERGDTAVPTEKDEYVVNRIEQMRKAAATFEADLAKTWKEWDRAHGEVVKALRIISGNFDESGCLPAVESNGQKPNMRTTSGTNTFGDANISEILSDAEKELEEVAAEATRETRENEKTFRKLILAEEYKLAQNMLAKKSRYD